MSDDPWNDISMDFVTGLHDRNGYKAILVRVDRVTKMCHLITMTEECDASALFDQFIEYIWKLHAFLETIVLN